MVRKFGKRGQEGKLYFIIFEIIAFAMVIIVILTAIKGIVNNSNYWKRYYSTDISLMSELVSTNQGDFVINYALKDQDKNFFTDVYGIKDRSYDINLLKGRVDVYSDPRDDDRYPQSFSYAESNYIDVKESSTLDKFIVLSKIGPGLSFDTFYSSSTPSSLSFSTKKDMTNLKFNSFSIDAKSLPYSKSMASLLSVYGRTYPQDEATIIFYYSAGSTFRIYYSDDMNSLRSKKMSELIGKAYSEDSRFSSNNYEINEYDGFLDGDDSFKKFLDDKESREFYVIIVMSDEELKISQNDFAQIVYKGVLEYYK